MPYLEAEREGLLEIWYIDEAGFNINRGASYGWALKGKLPVVKVPQQIINTSLLMAISLDKQIHYQFFEGGIQGKDFRGFMINLI